jgi:signal peptide peptidase SppA
VWLIDRLRRRAPVVPVLRLTGVIGSGGALRRGLSLAGLAGAIERAFRVSKAPAVALAISSPGGAPVQAALIAARIRELAEEKKKPVFAFVEDVAASGGYWLACAADEIYVDRSSIVGSIGVVSAGFGLHRLIERFGVERRVHTAGSRKAMLDPFAPERDEDVAKLESVQADIHEAFKALVRERRAGRLRADEETLFEGEFWTGGRAVELGLADRVGHIRPVLREKFGPDVRLRVATPARSWLMRGILPGTDRRLWDMTTAERPSGLPDGAAWVDAVLAAVEERAWWQRFGL